MILEFTIIFYSVYFSYAWNDEVDSVEEGLPPHGQDESYVRQ